MGYFERRLSNILSKLNFIFYGNCYEKQKKQILITSLFSGSSPDHFCCLNFLGAFPKKLELVIFARHLTISNLFHFQIS